MITTTGDLIAVGLEAIVSGIMSALGAGSVLLVVLLIAVAALHFSRRSA